MTMMNSRPCITVCDSLVEDEKSQDQGITAADNSVIEEAKNAVYGSKAIEYGDGIDCFHRIAAIANSIKDLTDTNHYTPEDIAMILQALKLARMQGPGPFKRDSYVDLIGYTDLRFRVKLDKIKGTNNT